MQIGLRSAHTKGLVPATSPGDQVPPCELPIFIKKFSRRGQILVPATCPLKLCWSLRVNCSWDKSLRPNESKTIADQYFRSHNPLRTLFQDGGRR